MNKRGQSQIWNFKDLMFTFLMLIFIFFAISTFLNAETNKIEDKVYYKTSSFKAVDVSLTYLKFHSTLMPGLTMGDLITLYCEGTQVPLVSETEKFLKEFFPLTYDEKFFQISCPAPLLIIGREGICSTREAHSRIQIPSLSNKIIHIFYCHKVKDSASTNYGGSPVLVK
jgi:hypothetical protein